MAWFSEVPVVDVHKDNFVDMWPTMMLAIKSSTFVAIDTELSGLGPRKALMAHSVEDRYKATYDIAKTRAMVSVGLSCFKIPFSGPGQEGHALPFYVQTFDVTLLCKEDYIVEPASVQFLVEHGFDFNKQYSKGVPFHRGIDKEEDERGMRQLFFELINSNIPLVLHNGLVDLVFLYQSLYTELPTTMSSFIADLSEMFVGGIYDTKYIAEFHARFSASYLEYVFRKSQRDNALSQSKGESYIAVEFPHYPSNMDHIQYKHCSLPTNLVEITSGETLQTKPAVTVCAQYANYGYCPQSTQCPKSHDPDMILDSEDISLAKKRRRKRRRKSRNDEIDPKQRKLSTISEDDEDAAVSVTGDNHKPLAHSQDNLERTGLIDASSVEPNGSSTNQNADNKVQSDKGGKTGLLANQRMQGHRAGFDAFMTGFAMATFVSNLGTCKLEGQAVPFTEKYQLGNLVNRLCLSGKDIPLQIVKSNFSKTSSHHKEKMKQLKSGKDD
ncbi:target of EGR1 protein 1-like [Ptychodera flava]|uniref:target of EGR1 protein 1-like n=1 Tax=Ptychodera flava TaxID=63121 RepID=UPI00396A1DB8